MKKNSKILLIIMVVVAVAMISGHFIYSYSSKRGQSIPVLMFHHIAQEGNGGAVLAYDHFKEDITALHNAGFNTITIKQLIDYVENGTALPSKAILITFDDGYTSNLELAAPILEEYGMNATIFVIGIDAGETISPVTGQELSPPYFALKDAKPFIDSGVLAIQSHTYNMHGEPADGYSVRKGVMPYDKEDKEEYKSAFENDISLMKEKLKNELGVDLYAMAYPYGLACKESESISESMGIKVTFTTQYGTNYVRVGEPETIRLMKRIGVGDDFTGESLVARLNKLMK